MTCLPDLIPYPPHDIREKIPSGEWTHCVEAWSYITHICLATTASAFSEKVKPDSSLTEFLSSYIENASLSADDEIHSKTKAETSLRRNVFLLTHRSLLEVENPPQALLHWHFLADLSRAYRGSEAMSQLLQHVWTLHERSIAKFLQNSKNKLIMSLSLRKNENFLDHDLLRRLLHITKALPGVGHFLMTGSDLLDCFASSYPALDPRSRKHTMTLTYLSFTALLQGDKPNPSLLLDHIFSLKASEPTDAKPQQASSSLLQDLVSSTPLLVKLRQQFAGSDASRAKSLIASLEDLRIPGQFHGRKRPREKVDKGKSKAPAASVNVHVHRMSLIAQIQDIFPDLGSAFVLQLLDEYNDDVEQATLYLLEDKLPENLQQADRSAELPANTAEYMNDLAPDLPPRPTPPTSPPLPERSKISDIPERRNVYDDDDLSNLTMKASNLHIGKANPNVTADDLLSNHGARKGGVNKAAILSALAAFDADDDERDDTYDIADVGGSVDAANRPGDELRDRETGGEDEAREAALFRAFKSTASVFERDAATRRSQQRQRLKNETGGMTDETIEGWAIMVRREPKRMRRLEERFALAAGGLSAAGMGQTQLDRTAWRAVDVEGDEGGDEQGEPQSSAPRGRGRGRGRGGAAGKGRAGNNNVAGSANEKDEQVSRQRKEANKGSRANHNRRDQRAKKMTRAGFPG